MKSAKFANMKSKKSISNKCSFLQYLPLFWPLRQSKAAVGPNLSLFQIHPLADIHFVIHGYVYGDVSIETPSLNFWFSE